MIDSTSFNSAHALSEKLAATKSGLVVIPNSVLAACIEASKTPMAFDYGNDNWEQAWNESLACMPIWGTRDNVTLADEDGGSTVVIPTALHESTMAEASGVASKGIRPPSEGAGAASPNPEPYSRTEQTYPCRDCE